MRPTYFVVVKLAYFYGSNLKSKNRKTKHDLTIKLITLMGMKSRNESIKLNYLALSII